MESGSVLFLVKSNFKHYYSDKLVDGVHFIGISEDLHDFVEKTKIVTNTDSESFSRMREIAANARALMQEFTHERVVKGVSHRLNELVLSTCIFEKSCVKRVFSCLRASRVATTAPIAPVREYIL